MSRLVEFETFRGKTTTQSVFPHADSHVAGADIMGRERKDIYIAVRNMQERLTEIEQDLGRFEQRIASRSSNTDS